MNALSYRRCAPCPVASAAPAPAALPISRPAPAPVAAPRLPSITAPATAPITVPTTALRAALSSAACCGDAPSCSAAYCLHDASSVRNWSKFFPVPGKVITLGPLGIVTQAPNAKRAAAGRANLNLLSIFIFNYLAGCGRTFCHPPGHSFTLG
jgi:hypothetical protein